MTPAAACRSYDVVVDVAVAVLALLVAPRSEREIHE